MDIEGVTSVAVITPDLAASRRLYVETLGLPLEHAPDDDYAHSEDIPGVRHFGVWPLRQAAQACFGQDEWPADVPVPQVGIEFEVASVSAASAAASELSERGFTVLHGPRTEPWGQTVARLLSPEGAIVGISFVPSLH